MSNVIRLKARIKEYFCKVIDESEEDFMSKEDKNVLTYNKDIQKMIDEELAKEQQECNSDLISRKKLIEDLFYSVDGNRYPTRDCDNFPITISYEYLRKCINNQPQVQPIVRTTEEVVEMLNKISCTECDKNSSHCHFSETECKNYWYEWLTKKEV